MTHTLTDTRPRLATLDGLRGLAIALMVLDHVLVLTAPTNTLRYTLTRAALPAFALVAGYLWRPGWRARYLTIAAAGVVATVAGQLVGVAQPDVLFVILLAYGYVALVDRVGVTDPAALLAVAVVLMAIAETGWQWSVDGYDPRWVAGLMLLGRTVDVPRLGERLPAARVLAAIGRRPLAWYVGHLVALATIGVVT